MIAFDNTISLGHVLTFFGFIATAIGAFYALKGRLIAIEVQNKAQIDLIAGMQSEIKELKAATVTMGRFDERLIALQREVTELRHGQGFIKPA